MSSPEEGKIETKLVFGLPRDSPLQACPRCETQIDTTSGEPLANVTCPQCGENLTIRGWIGKFRLPRIAGRGGMGVVYQGVDTILNRPAALKLLRRDHGGNEKLMDQLANEAAITASINHPHVIKVYSTGMDHGRFYIAMELADNLSL